MTIFSILEKSFSKTVFKNVVKCTLNFHFRICLGTEIFLYVYIFNLRTCHYSYLKFVVMKKKLKSTSEAKLTLIQLFQQNQYKRISYKNYNKVLKNMIKVNN